MKEFKCEVGPEVFYPKDTLKKVVNGSIGSFEVVDFRIPRKNEFYFSIYGEIELLEYGSIGPRFILQKKKEPVSPDISCTLTVRDVYGEEPVYIPAGYEFVDFRKTKSGDRFVGAVSKDVYIVPSGSPGSELPLIIVKKVSQ